MAVYTHISEQDLKHYLSGFDLGALVSFNGITDGIENTNYKLVTAKGAYILTLFEKRVRTEDLPFYIAFMEYLRTKDIPCPGVIGDKNGKKIVPLNGKAAIVTTFLEGAWPKKIGEFHAAAVGATLAHMHLAGGKFTLKRENTMSLPAWKHLIGQCGAQPELQRELDALEKFWPRTLPSGAVHADLFPDNVFFSGQELSGVIDFYFSCTDTFAYDLMLTLNAWCFMPDGAMDVKKSAAFLSAYQKHRPLSAAEKEALPFFGRAAALRIIATRLYDSLHPVAGAVVRPKDPAEYLRILKFYQTGAFKI